MSNPIRKSMVWLGLADDQYEESSPRRPSRARRSSPPHPLPSSTRPPPAAAAPAAAPAAEPVEPMTPHTQHHTGAGDAAPPPHASARTQVPEMNEILTVHPRQYRDAQQIAEHFRDGTPVIINLTQMSEAEARRLVDFASGLSHGLRGRIERVTSKVFLLSPEHITVSGEESGAESDLEATFCAKRASRHRS